MYNMTQNRLPAPYELNNQQTVAPTAGQYLAKGGRTHKHKHMTTVHMNPHELRVLDHLQGRPEYSSEGVKTYPGLEELLKNPHIIHNVHHHARRCRQHHAYGGLTPAMQHLRAGGRYGDSELAMIGPHTRRLFNELAGHPTINPHTGHPEYFSIGNALSGLWNTVKGVASPVLSAVKDIASPVLGMLGMGGGGGGESNASASTPSFSDAFRGIAQAAAPSLLPMAQQALGNRFGNVGRMAGNLLSQGAQSMLGEPRGEMNPYLSAIGRGIGSAAQSYGNNGNASQVFGHGLQHFGSQIGGRMGNALANTGQAFGQGQNWREAAQRGSRGYQEYVEPSAPPMAANQSYNPYEESPYQQEEPYEMYG